MRSTSWDRSAFLLTYDDWGGWYDHVVPPQVDKNGYGLRVPALMVSPYAKRGHVDSTLLDFTSILKFIEDNWDIKSLATRDAKANSFVSAFDFSQAPREPILVPFERVVKEQRAEPRRVVIYAAYGGALILAALMFVWTAIGSDLRKQSLAYFNRLTQPREPLT
jgi:phospholipase C